MTVLIDLPRVFIGTAGWSLPKAEQGHFPALGSHLGRYASCFAGVEINSSFRRSHKPAIWARWRDAVPPGFRFSVKMPKAITHTARPNVTADLIAAFIDEISVLEAKLGCLLVQVPPSLGYDATIAARFFKNLRARTAVSIACEPRHESWFTPEADALLRQLDVARVAADPARVPAAGEPGGSRQFSYFRLHGSPKVYYSSYSDEYIHRLADRLKREAKEGRTVWCIFDNTTLGAATGNAFDLKAMLSSVCSI
ncbi:MAG: DUF72 domain-containing protein [Verrucomicrobiota bacterium]|nr:DUF72 domain-containing protein [Verrucomicrobiota bacterium]